MDRSVKFSPKQRKPSFFKPLVNQNFSTRLQIPPAFVNKYGEYLSSRIVLKNYLNISWEVEVTKIKRSSYFQNGWETFVADNKLEFGDFMVFTYSSNSTFEFEMYGKTCLFKEDENTYEAVDASKENQEQVVKVDAKSGEKDVIIVDSDDDQGESGQLKHSVGKRRKTDSTRKRRRQGDEDVNFNSAYPFFHVELTHTYLASYLPIPLTFFRERMRMGDQEIKLEKDEQMWSVNLYVNYRKSTNSPDARFTVGWKRFVRENDLKERDVCIFEMIKTDAPYIFRVHIHIHNR